MLIPYLGKQIRVEISDGRVIEGEFQVEITVEHLFRSQIIRSKIR